MYVLCACACTCIHKHISYNTYMEAKRQSEGISCLLPLGGSQEGKPLTWWAILPVHLHAVLRKLLFKAIFQFSNCPTSFQTYSWKLTQAIWQNKSYQPLCPKIIIKSRQPAMNKNSQVEFRNPIKSRDEHKPQQSQNWRTREQEVGKAAWQRPLSYSGKKRSGSQLSATHHWPHNESIANPVVCSTLALPDTGFCHRGPH